MQNRKRDTDVRTDFGTLWEKVRVGCFERTTSKHVYYLWWNRSPAQVGCMRQVLRDGALGRPRGIGWRGRWEGGSGRGTHVNPWLIHVNVWQKPLQYCKVISLQLIKINEKNAKTLWICLYVIKIVCCCYCLVAKPCLFCDPMDSSLPGSSIHRIVQAGILEWVAISFSRGSSQPRNWTCSCCCLSCSVGKFFTAEPLGKPIILLGMWTYLIFKHF